MRNRDDGGPSTRRPAMFRNETWLLMFSATLLAVGVAAGSASAATTYSGPMRAFAIEYGTRLQVQFPAMAAKGANTRIDLHAPQAWLYSPQGNAVAVANTPADLQRWTEQFPPLNRTALPGQLTLANMLDVVTAAAHASPSVRVAGDQWTVVSLVYAEACPQCVEFERGVTKLAAKYPKQLHVVVMRASFGG